MATKTLTEEFKASAIDLCGRQIVMDFLLRECTSTSGDPLDPQLKAQLDEATGLLLANPPSLEDLRNSIKEIYREGSADDLARALIDYADSFGDDATGFKSSGLSFAEKAAAVKAKANKPKI